jgi:hypothetical protein
LCVRTFLPMHDSDCLRTRLRRMVRRGEIDILWKDKGGGRVIVELNEGRKSDVAVGQTLRYIGWVMKNMKTKTRGMIVVNEPREKLDFAILPVANLIRVKYYRMRFELSERYEGSE